MNQYELILESEFLSVEKSTCINDTLNKKICTDIVTVGIVEKIDDNIEIDNAIQLKMIFKEYD